jgi:hypothetical protein
MYGGGCEGGASNAAYSQISLIRTKNTLLCQRTEVNFERIDNRFQYSTLLWGRRVAMSREAFSYANGAE